MTSLAALPQQQTHGFGELQFRLGGFRGNGRQATRFFHARPGIGQGAFELPYFPFRLGHQIPRDEVAHIRRRRFQRELHRFDRRLPIAEHRRDARLNLLG